MAPDVNDLFPESVAERAPGVRVHTTGILPSQVISTLIGRNVIDAEPAIEAHQIQPASLDLRLGRYAYRVRASFLPGAEHRVDTKIEQFAMHRIALDDGAVLERGCVYIAPLMETLKLERNDAAIANAKSTTGRLGIFTRLITDRAAEFDRVPHGYQGPLYAEIVPGSFSILVRTGSRLSQLRIRRGNPPYFDGPIRHLHKATTLVQGDNPDIASGFGLTVDLVGDGRAPIGYRARKHAGLIDFDAVAEYEPLDFWDPIERGRDGTLILDPGDFYILASREAVAVPPDYAAEMRPYDPMVGEFRVHYAGFFDPGFGHAGAGARAVLEVRSHDVPFVLEHGQTVGRLLYQRLTEPADRLYGPGIGSAYQGQDLALAKPFRKPAPRDA